MPCSIEDNAPEFLVVNVGSQLLKRISFTSYVSLNVMHMCNTHSILLNYVPHMYLPFQLTQPLSDTQTLEYKK